MFPTKLIIPERLHPTHNSQARWEPPRTGRKFVGAAGVAAAVLGAEMNQAREADSNFLGHHHQFISKMGKPR